MTNITNIRTDMAIVTARCCVSVTTASSCTAS